MDEAVVTETPAEISRRFMAGDLIKAVMRQTREMQVGWAVMTDLQRERLTEQIADDVKDAVRQVIDILTARGAPSVHASVESVTFKKGIKATLIFSKDSADRHDIADAVNQDVLIVLPQYELAFGGTAAPEKSTADMFDNKPPAGSAATGDDDDDE